MIAHLAAALKGHGFTYSESMDDEDIMVWGLRIHQLLWAEIDSSGFLTLERKLEFGKSYLHKVTLPCPIRTVQQLDAIMTFFVIDNDEPIPGQAQSALKKSLMRIENRC